MLLQATFCINSLAHLLGRRTFDEGASARNSTVTALVTFGEGYHSYHHRFPFDFRNGVRWWHYDPSKWLIVCLERVRLTSRLRRAAPASIDAAADMAGESPRSPLANNPRSVNMTVSKRAAAKRPERPSWKSPGSPHELGTAEQLAHAIVTERADLLPSVERIMTAPLDGERRVRALGLFRDSLTTPGDRHRDPRVAIEQCMTDGSADGSHAPPPVHDPASAPVRPPRRHPVSERVLERANQEAPGFGSICCTGTSSVVSHGPMVQQ